MRMFIKAEINCFHICECECEKIDCLIWTRECVCVCGGWAWQQ